MIDASTFLRRALLADAVFSGVAALGFTFGAGAFATLFNLPEALFRETGLFLIAYTALVGWLASRTVSAEATRAAGRGRQRRLDGGQHRAAVLRRGVAKSCRRAHGRGASDRNRRVRGAAICGLAEERERSGCVKRARYPEAPA